MFDVMPPAWLLWMVCVSHVGLLVGLVGWWLKAARKQSQVDHIDRVQSIIMGDGDPRNNWTGG